MRVLEQIHSQLLQAASVPKEKQAVFYKTGAGHYAEHDKFLGVSVPVLRKIAKDYANLTPDVVRLLINSPFNEERLLALLILVWQYQQADPQSKERIYQFYMANLQGINNWNLVDASAHLIVGAHLLTADKQVLLDLAQSKIVWERRIAIVATWHFIRNNDLGWTFKISELLLTDTHDLIHKAVGWMLREAGKRNAAQLVSFLDKHVSYMPRTMLRYSIEKFTVEHRRAYLDYPPLKSKLSIAS